MSITLKKKRASPLKDCPKCKTKMHCRKSECVCGHEFYKKKISSVVNWKELKTGDVIRSLHGGGPYWKDPETHEKQYIGSYGKFVVNKVGLDYIICFELDGYKIKSAQHVLYMGDNVKSGICDNLYRCPHKLLNISIKGKERIK